jgi:hypothetical protein
VFFKIFPDIRLESPVPGLLERSTQALDVSNKFGAVLVAGQGSLLIFRAEDILSAQSKARGGGDSNNEHIEVAQVPHVNVVNPAFGDCPPCLVTISHGEEFVAVDTVRGGACFVLVFKLDQFLRQVGICKRKKVIDDSDSRFKMDFNMTAGWKSKSVM